MAERTSGCRTRTASPSATSSPEATAASSASSSTPRVAAAPRTTVSSPVSSAAASSSSDCTGAGSCRLRSRKACSTRVDRCSWVGSGADPPSWSGAELGGQLEQRQRVAAGLGDEPFGDLRRGRGARALRPAGPGPRPGRARTAPARRCRRDGTASPRRLGRRRPGARGRHRAGGRRTAARRRWRGRASGRPRRRTARSSPRPRRSAATVSRPRPGTARSRGRPPRRTRPAAPGPGGRAARRAAASPGSSSRCSAANANGASTSRPWVRRTSASPASADERLEERGLADARLAADHHAAGRPVPRLRRGVRPGVRSRAHGRLAPCDRTTAATRRRLPNPAL